MAPSAAPSTQQSYSAGNCKLDLTLQPSALSQWYPKPIADQLAFKLWMSGDRDAKPTLLAEGDRATLQAIASYLEHRTQATLTLGRAARDRLDPPKLPNGVRLPQPLSYLQLCDLSSVLAQYQQHTKPLPISLSLATKTAQTVALPEPSLARTAQLSTGRRGRLIPFPMGRRTAWASSAAAVLFAVGITTALLNQTSTSEQSSVANSELAEPEIIGANPDRLRLNKSAESAGDAPLEDSLSARLPNAQLPNTQLPNNPLPGNRAASPSNRSQEETAPNSTGQRVPGLSAPSQTTGRSSSPSASNPPANGSPSSTPTPSKSPATASVESSADRNSAFSTESAIPSNNSRSARQDNTQPSRSDTASEDISIAAAPIPANRPAPDAASDRKIAASLEAETSDRAASESPAAEADLPALETSTSQARARISNEAIAQQEAETLTQVQNYFFNQHNQQSANETISKPLSYRLQLSPSGEIVSFTALTEAGEAYRDRLLPNSNLSFPPSSSAALSNGLILKVTVMPDGKVTAERF